ncbi:MAG: hypothetical protein WKF86_01655, partial [Acidimicrobiales bacterium]
GAVVLWPLIEVIRIISQPAHAIEYGDYALFELAARDAWRLDQLLGPSAHPGFHHPGPAMFYLLAPAVRLMEPGPGLYLGALLINASALVAAVAFFWHQLGPRVALWAAVAVNLLCLAVDLDTLRQPWNSLVIITPMLLFAVLWAAALTRTAGAFLWAAVVGSYELQSHVTTALFVFLMLVAAGGWLLVRWWRSPPPRFASGWWRHWGRATGAPTLVLVWVPSTIELLVGRPNNLSLVLAWLRENGKTASIGLGEATGIVLRSVSVWRSDDARSSLLGSLTWWSVPVPDSRLHEAVGLLILVAGAAVLMWLVRRQLWFAAALAGSALLAAPVAIFTVTRAGDDNYAFTTGWLAFVPYVLLIALGIGVLDQVASPARPATAPGAGPRRRARSASAVLGAVALATSLTTAVVVLRQRPLAEVMQERAALAPFTADAVAQLRPEDRSIGIGVLSPDTWETAAGVVLELERRGYRTVVDPRQVGFFGKKRTEPHPVDVMFSFYLTADPAAAASAPGQTVTAAGTTVMSAWRPA